jgi:hypothetical protein
MMKKPDMCAMVVGDSVCCVRPGGGVEGSLVEGSLSPCRLVAALTRWEVELTTELLISDASSTTNQALCGLGEIETPVNWAVLVSTRDQNPMN